MSLPLLIDMNLSVEWVDFFRRHGREAVHWSTCGNPTAEDAVLMQWAARQRHILFTHDLDFATTLALTHVAEPSVIQVRSQRV